MQGEFPTELRIERILALESSIHRSGRRFSDDDPKVKDPPTAGRRVPAKEP
jgi:hypothetical protein